MARRTGISIIPRLAAGLFWAAKNGTRLKLSKISMAWSVRFSQARLVGKIHPRGVHPNFAKASLGEPATSGVTE
ncbi:hypothetical protein A3H87_04640 [Candidatus Curtissbacteria bacterium RIFCSPLOWO2_02_FULL_42_37]|nr:MAG: hypothetical protein A3H87_04640 [Candidatus Curtissbacteria bacterium RIFCSPLOWO2_02_FULL_42_37]